MSAKNVPTSKESAEGNMSDDEPDQEFLQALEQEASEFKKA